MSELGEYIQRYYVIRDLKKSNVWQNLAWATTEMGEAYELLLAREGGWKRNNPDTHPEWDKKKFGEELGDAIMMLIVAGQVEGVDALDALVDKLTRKLEAHVPNLHD
jgi:NTP pyrophosphatase (non-canonical NTP hydrolase)